MKRFHVSKNLLKTVTEGYAINENGNIYAYNSFMYFTAPCDANETYTFSLDTGLSNTAVRIHAFNGDTWISQLIEKAIQSTPITVTTPANTTNLKISIVKDALNYHCMLNEGETTLPYEPYGNTWQTKSPPKYGTATDIITELPQEIITDGQPIGANLCSLTEGYSNVINNVRFTITNGLLTINGTAVGSGGRGNKLTPVFTLPAGTYCISFTEQPPDFTGYVNKNSDNTVIGYTSVGNFTLVEDTEVYIGCNVVSEKEYDATIGIMLNAGSTTLPYQPYAPTIIKGNMVQSGAPTPINPITPSETGDRTGNLFDTSLPKTDYVANVYQWTLSGLTPNAQYTCSSSFVQSGAYANIWFGGTSSGTNGVSANSPKTMTANSNGEIMIYINHDPDAAYDQIVGGTVWIMVNSGSTPLPYEPYGYKIPISSANTTTPVYLGEVQSTRKIKQVILTGEEDWTYESQYSRFSTFGILTVSFGIRATPMYCSHFQVVDDGRVIADVPNNSCYSGDVGSSGVYFKAEAYGSAEDFKTYLQQQYASGTPITLWVILATETAGILNEPIRKIGDYSDSVSVANIPTTAERQTFDVDTSLKPSEVQLTYHGWHRNQPLLKSKNLFDKSVASINAYPAANTTIASSPNTRTAYCICKPNTTYTISKIASKRFIVGYTKTIPAIGETYYGNITDNEATEITITTGTDALYLIIFYYHSSYDTLTESEIKDSIMVNTGSSPLPYQPYWVDG